MNMDSNDKEKLRFYFHLICHFRDSAGIKQERKYEIHSYLPIGCYFWFYFSISIIQWLLVLFAIGGMIALELMNTAIERLVDYISPQFHPLAKQAKDLAAGAVFSFAILSVIIGCIIFVPYIFCSSANGTF